MPKNQTHATNNAQRQKIGGKREKNEKCKTNEKQKQNNTNT